jgi:tetratricopeptide (TPR) repeat protein
MFGALQIKREAIGRLGVPVVLWMVEGNLIDLAWRAADFFVWRGGIYDFRSPDRQRAGEFDQALVQMLQVYSPSLISPDDLRQRITLFEQILTRLQAEGQPSLRRIAGLHVDLGNIHYHLNEWDKALDHYQQAREIRERLGDTAGVAASYWNIGLVHEKQGRIEEAFPLLEHAVEIERRLGHPDAEKHAAYVEKLRSAVSTDEKRITG